ncbi:unnamed protein product [Rotaria sordida]|uniref:Uncharacterized protein n=1 Tax=Rotaria sordida TaxID=392033 RepID=A0A814AJL3_9BILA|nr:unnamed protein product [Rotaria sordida]
MDNMFNDLEIDMSSNIPRDLNKKMRKRKQFGSIMEFHITKSNSNDVLRNSEDELFIPHRKISITKLHSSRYLRLRNYSQHILSFSFLCIFMIVCFSLTYTNIELKNEVHSLSSRINEVEKKSLKMELNNILPSIEQIKTRINFLENWNFSFVYNQLQKLQVQILLNKNNFVSSNLQKIEYKSTYFPKKSNELDNLNQETKIRLENMMHKNINNFVSSNLQKIEYKSTYFPKKSNELDNLNQETKIRLENMMHKNIVRLYEQFNSLRNEIQSFNQHIKIQELLKRFEQLTNLIHNSSDETLIILNEFQFDLDKLQNQIDECKCSKEPISLRASVVDADELQPNIVTKPYIIDFSSTQMAKNPFKKMNDENKQI